MNVVSVIPSGRSPQRVDGQTITTASAVTKPKQVIRPMPALSKARSWIRPACSTHSRAPFLPKTPWSESPISSNSPSR